MEAVHGIGKGGPDRVNGEISIEGTIQIGAPSLEGGARGSLLITQIVTLTHEGVDGTHGETLGLGQNQEGVVKILGARPGDLHAAIIRCGKVGCHSRAASTD